ncbi:MAG: redoxin domain-containing protein [Verrucomicrobia bacterium]|nr:redoxin domain-containing protein [Verrucomicrobiota bacterium]
MMIDLLLALSAALAADTATFPNAQPPALGAIVRDFELVDTHRRTRTFGSFPDKKAYVVVFLGTECPVANLYVPRLIALHGEFESRGVQFLGINSNPQDSFARMAGHAQEREIPFPVLKDFDQKFAKSIGATRTPEVFLLDADRAIRYRGRIDDQYTVIHRRPEAARDDLKLALQEWIETKKIAVTGTTVSGCAITWLDQPRVQEPVTYAKHIAPILQQRCQECHRPGQVGPFSLLTYDAAKRRSAMLYEAVLEERMPPWHADPHYGAFANDRRLLPREREWLLAWIEQDCPLGAEETAPSAKDFPEGWTIGTPDLVMQMPVEETVPATGVVPYKYYEVDPGFKEDVWFQAAEARPGNRQVVHHIVVYMQVQGQRIFAKDGTTSILVGWAPGDMPAMFPDGVAKRIPAGAKLRFEVHYTPNGTEQQDRSSIGIILAKEKPKQEAMMNILAKWRFEIPPGAPAHREQASYTFPEDAHILSLMPHMHYRGVRAYYEAKFPDGRTERLLSVPSYDFNWQSVYRFREPLFTPKGTTITFTGFWDNSRDNPLNPDPTRAVPWGEQTWDEMLNGWLEFVFVDPPGQQVALQDAGPGP